MKKGFIVCCLMLMAGSAQGQELDCISNTGNNATVIFPVSAITMLESGDIIYARHEALCVGEGVYQDGNSLALTVWGDNTQTPGVDGIPVNALIEYSVYRPSTGVMENDITVSYRASDGRYVRDAIYEIALFAPNSPLPVELTSFQSLVDGRDVVLDWETASEINNAGFEVQHKALAGPFQEVAFVEGKGTTDQAQQYRYEVSGLEPGTHRFRLKQVDYDGSFEYSPEIEVQVEVPTRVYASAAYPNPFEQYTEITLTTRRTEFVEVQVYDVRGRLVKTLYRGTVQAESSKVIRLDAQALSDGVYFVQIRGRSFVETRTVVLHSAR